MYECFKLKIGVDEYIKFESNGKSLVFENTILSKNQKHTYYIK